MTDGRPNSRSDCVRSVPSRRRFLTAAGTTALGGVPGFGAASDGPGPTIRIDGSEPRSPISVEVAETVRRVRSDVTIDVDFSETERAVERFVDGELDVLHASRPLLPDEARDATDNDVAYDLHESAIDGAATLVHREPTWDRCLDAEECTAVWNTPGAETWAELVPGDARVDSIRVESGDSMGSPIERATRSVRDEYVPNEATSLIVRGVRAHQYARGFGGTGHYEIDPERVSTSSAVDGTDQTPLVRLRFSYVNADSLVYEPVRTFARLYTETVDVLTEGIQYVTATTGDTHPYEGVS